MIMEILTIVQNCAITKLLNAIFYDAEQYFESAMIFAQYRNLPSNAVLPNGWKTSKALLFV